VNFPYLPGPELRQAAALDQPVQVGQGENLAPRRQQQFFHVLAAHFEAIDEALAIAA
jgi:hypothetical protein